MQFSPSRLGGSLLGVPAPYDASVLPNLPGPAQTRIGAWFDRHDVVTRITAIVAVITGAAYLVWRVGYSFEGANVPLSLVLLAAEAFGWWSLISLTVFAWSNPKAQRPAATPGRSVAVIVCTYNESLDVLRTTLAGCRALSYPHRTYLLDDGRRESMRDLAAEMGAEWITRPDNRHAKAGNINAALPNITEDLIFVLDADHVPLPDALDALVGYFDDDRVALVQTPHDFYNHDSAQHYAVGRHEQSMFYEVICPGKSRHNAAFWCGSATLLRREALLDVGGVATETIAEDFHTTIKLHADGWSTHYHHEVLVQGLAPHDLDGYLLQRDRWARGNLAVFASTESPLRNRSLSPMQRWSYATSLMSYGAPLARIVPLFVLAIALFTGALPIHASLLTLVSLWLPWMLGSVFAATALCRGHIRFKESVHYELLCAEIYTRALRCAFKPAKTAFKVTPKEGTDLGGFDAVRKLRLTLAVLVLLVSATIVRLVDTFANLDLLPKLPSGALIVLPVLALIESRRLARTLVIVARRRQRRAEYRFPVELAAVVDSAPGTVVDASLSGLGITLATTDAPEPGARIAVSTTLPTVSTHREVNLHATVRSIRPVAGQEGTTYIGCVIDEIDTETKDALIEMCYLVVPYRRLRGRDLTRGEPLEVAEAGQEHVTTREHHHVARRLPHLPSLAETTRTKVGGPAASTWP